MEEKEKQVKELIRHAIRRLNAASVAYYAGNPVMSDHEWDESFDNLKKWEADTGIIFPDSPTQKVGAEIVTELKKVRHEKPALSQDKVKYAEREDLIKWLGDEMAVMSWKCDGSTVVLTYEDGKLIQAATRGNGEEGSDITHNARFFKGIPIQIPFKGHLVVRGEAMMTYEEFERVNAASGGIYENPRNLATSTIQMLDSNESRKREIIYKAFELVSPEPRDEIFRPDEKHPGNGLVLSLLGDRLDWLEELGFDVVERAYVDATNILDKVEECKDLVKDLAFPTDGLVIAFNDCVYAESLGATGHHYRGSIALKWTDETRRSILRDVFWSVGKTGVITPVAVFDGVRLGAGSTVKRASLHNLSILRAVPLRGGVPKGINQYMSLGDSVDVYLANMIIPQIASYGHDGEYTPEHPRTSIEIPKICPVCGAGTVKREHNGVITLHCLNEDCAARHIGGLMNTFSKDGLFVKGLGESQIQDLVETGFLKRPIDMYGLVEYRDLPESLSKLPGWGPKKWENLKEAINASREATLQRFLYSLTIPLLGNDLSKKLAKYWDGDETRFLGFVDQVGQPNGYSKGMAELCAIDGIGEEKASNVVKWAQKINTHKDLGKELIDLLHELSFPAPDVGSSTDSDTLEGLTFVITGSVHDYKNRDEFKASVEARGGKVVGSVSAKTSYLVNNDAESTSGKNKKAKELGIEIISEDEFITRFGR